MPVDISEKDFEAQIEHVLRNAHGYHKRLPEDYDRHLCLIPADVIDFIRGTQPEAWRALRAVYQDEAETRFLRRLASEIDKRGTLVCLAQWTQRRRRCHQAGLLRPRHRDESRLSAPVPRQYLFRLAATALQTPAPISRLIWRSSSTACPSSPPNSRTTSPDRMPSMPCVNIRQRPRPERAAVQVRALPRPFRRRSRPGLRDHATAGRIDLSSCPFNKGKYGGAGNLPAHDNFAAHYLWEEVWAHGQPAQPAGAIHLHHRKRWQEGNDLPALSST